MTVNTDQIAEQLEIARKDLLDLTLRNPLLNYRPLKAKGLDILCDSVQDIFVHIVREKHSYSFQPKQSSTRNATSKETSITIPEALDEHELLEAKQGESSDSFDVQATEESMNSSKKTGKGTFTLDTPYDVKELDKRLLGTYYAAKTYIEEQGINVLYIAMGMLSWTETSQESAKVLKAPLVLIPVFLTRQSAQEGFRIQYTEDEISENPSLYKKLENEFGIKLPAFPENFEDFVPTDYFKKVSQEIKSFQRWKVDEQALYLGFFSFGKFMMYKDLDASIWPEDRNPIEHAILQKLLGPGFQEPSASIGDGELLDDHLLPTDVHNVMDADSSQVLAIADVKNGRNLVVQGPPGTGKSQTIANVIAELLHNGKRVLFVAEKMAALQVVRSRLGKVGLGAACLELHSHKANKKAVLDDLRNTWYGSSPQAPNSVTDLALLKVSRDSLNAYAKSLHEPVKESGFTPYQSLGHLVTLQIPDNVTLPRIHGVWTEESYQKKRALIEDAQSLLKEVGLPSAHPFWGSHLMYLMPSDSEDIRHLILQSQSALARLTSVIEQLSSTYGTPAGADHAEVKRILVEIQMLISAPIPDEANMPFGVWSTKREEIQALTTALRSMADVHTAFDAKIRLDAWKEALRGEREVLTRYEHKLFRSFSGEFRQARKRALMLVHSQDIHDLISGLEAIEKVQSYAAVWKAKEDVATEVFGHLGQQDDSRAGVLASWGEWGLHLYADVASERKPAWLLRMAGTDRGKKAWREKGSLLESLIIEWETVMQELIKRLAFGDDAQGSLLPSKTYAEWEQQLQQWSDHLSSLPALVRINQLSEKLQLEGLPDWGATVEQWDGASKHLTNAFNRAWHRAVLEEAYRERPVLRDFNGSEHRQILSRFQQLDSWHMLINQKQIAKNHWDHLPDNHAVGQVGVLRHEFQKMRRHMPIRKLLQEAGHAVQTIKPVFMMSPMSIATYLSPDSVTFDVVIFDEASQVRPVDAYGAILRGKQIVVVGDRQQLPPTSFFDRITADEEGDEEHIASDVESILTLLSSRGVPERMLRWHYRSRHESLIAVSNAEFYNNELVVFPSPTLSGEKTGLVYRYLPETSYDRGGSRTNRKEAAAVAQAVIQHAKHHPKQSLGVVAFSTAQMDAIQAEIEMLRRKSPDTEGFFSSGKADPFFVKNLENVQGDERDVIFISVGYGRDENGHFTMSFGPLNNSGGERRLNVMISRARLRCEVFTNLLPEDIDLNKSNARGVEAFKTFLEYAKSGKLGISLPTGRDADSPFEEAVRDALVRQGYRVEPQVGAGGFRIDMAVIDPDHPGRYLVGIECDGATYHRARSARDRDRLRQQILEGLGWKLIRIWSTDWFRDPAKELKHVIEAIEMERASSKEPILSEIEEGETDQSEEAIKEDEDAMVELSPESEEISVEERGFHALSVPYEVSKLSIDLHGNELHTVPRVQLAAWIEDVVSVESPVHVDEVYRRIANAAGVRRVGVRIRSAMELALRVSIKNGVTRRGSFLWHHSMTEAQIRDRSHTSEVSRKMEHIAPEEIRAAAICVLHQSAGIEPENLPTNVARLFGIQRLTEDSRALIDGEMGRMAKEGQAVMSGRYLIAATEESEPVQTNRAQSDSM